MPGYRDVEKCHFYYKIGVCRHGDKCSKRHTRPISSKTIIIYNMYIIPNEITNIEELQKDFDSFYEDVFMEASKFGEIQEILVCENKTDHLNGNVYIKYFQNEEAKAALDNFNTRWYNERPLYCDFCHVTDFHEAVCRSHVTNSCERGELCNFIHERRTSSGLITDLKNSQWKKNHVNTL